MLRIKGKSKTLAMHTVVVLIALGRLYNCSLILFLKCICRFLGSNMFATCSDDNTVKVWDTRRLKVAKRTLQGHSNWV